MTGILARIGGERSGFDLSARGYQVLFRANECNRCPGCGRAQWYVGRVTAECVFCGTALPLAEARWGEGGSAPSYARHQSEVDEIPLGHDERRRQRRKAGDGRVVTVLLDGVRTTFAVENYSASGVMIAAPAELVRSSLVEVVSPSGEIVSAEVRWSEPGYAGLKFSKSLPLALAPSNRVP